MAKNRYGWNKRLKELARKMKQEEKMRRRQNRARTGQAAEPPRESGGESPSETGEA